MVEGQISILDPGCKLLVPVNDIIDPRLSIVIPALNEDATIGLFIEWCFTGIRNIDLATEILIVDSSSDRTAEIALAQGARVLKTPLRGLGRAYIDAVPYIRGKYVLMGDCDCTYDFRELQPFVDKFKQGFEFIMGSRFAGHIEPGAMPLLHRYFGSPLTTHFLNAIYGQRFTDIHCGMRGITLDALRRMKLKSQSWEYASEMILKSVYMGLKTTEIPISFFKDRNGRVSHFKRQGILSPWGAGWITMKALFMHKADFFLFAPGIICLFMGMSIVLLLSAGAQVLDGLGFSLYWQLLGAFLSVLGAHLFYSGVIARLLYDYKGEVTQMWIRIFAYNRSMILSIVLVILGFMAVVPFLNEYIANKFQFPHGNPVSGHLAITGIVFIVLSFINFTSTLLMHAICRFRDDYKSSS